jgi:hypothetical protein
MGTSVETTVSEKSSFHSAISSWSGYNYQGKVALYVGLDLLNKIRVEEIHQYCLELEWLEDFSIKQNGSYLSIHQVKSYKKKIFSEYKDAIWNLLGKSIAINVENTYLHTSEDIVSIEEIKQKLLSTKEPTDSSKDHYTAADYRDMAMDGNNFETSFSKFSRYLYCSGQNYCPLDEIEGKIKEKIREYYDTNQCQQTDGQVNAVYLHLLGEMDRHITKRHEMEQKNVGGTDTIPFIKLHEVLNENWEEPTQEYFARHLKEVFYTCCEQQIKSLVDREKDKDDIQRLENYISKFISLDDNKFLLFCKYITPHVNVQKMNINGYRNLIQDNGIKKAFLRSLHEVKQELVDEKYMFHKRDGQEIISYLPTTIDTQKNETEFIDDDYEIGLLASNILANSAIDEFLFEVDVMISGFINMDSLDEAANKIKDVPDEDTERDQEKHNRITKIKKIKMVDVKEAGKDFDV